MIYRDSNDNLIEINKSVYLTDTEFLKHILEIKIYKPNPHLNPNLNSNIISDCGNTKDLIDKFLMENAIKEKNNQNKYNKR